MQSARAKPENSLSEFPCVQKSCHTFCTPACDHGSGRQTYLKFNTFSTRTLAYCTLPTPNPDHKHNTRIVSELHFHPNLQDYTLKPETLNQVLSPQPHPPQPQTPDCKAPPLNHSALPSYPKLLPPKFATNTKQPQQP